MSVRVTGEAVSCHVALGTSDVVAHRRSTSGPFVLGPRGDLLPLYPLDHPVRSVRRRSLPRPGCFPTRLDPYRRTPWLGRGEKRTHVANAVMSPRGPRQGIEMGDRNE